MVSQGYVAIAGPCGSGKTSAMMAYLATNPSCACISEIEPSAEIVNEDRLTPESAQHFQEDITRSRCRQITARSSSGILLVDRTFEEDREIFLPLYKRLGFLTDSQIKTLTDLSLESEALVGAPKAIILLSGRLDVLKKRLYEDGNRRPRWLLESFDLQYEMYAKWGSKASGRVTVKDTSDIDSKAVAAFLEHLFASQRGR